MAVNESAGLIRYKDKEGNLNILLPITTKDNVDGIDDIEASLSETIKFTKQTLTDSQKAQARDNLGIEAIVGYTHPETHPASMIEGLSEIATDGRFENLLNKPFFDLPKLETTDIAFTQFEEGYSLWAGELPGIWEQLLGETYKITWDGVEYTCVCKDAGPELGFTSLHYFGNATKILGAGIGVDTGEPFAITINIDTGTDGCGKPVVHTDDSKSWHTMSLTPVNPVKKIDPKYLPEGYGNSDGSGSETGSSIPSFTTEDEGKVLSIKDGVPSWESVAGSTTTTKDDLFSEQVVEPFHSSSTYGGLYIRGFNFPESGLTDDLTDSFELTLGETYYVEWDGTEYEVTPSDASAIKSGSLFLGNGAPMSLPGNGEPFAIGWTYGSGVTFISLVDQLESHTIRIYQKVESTAAISWNDLADKPFSEERGLVDLLPETTYSEFSFEDKYGVYAASESVTYKLTVGETYTVFWDGQEYTCTAQDSSSVMSNTVCIGNASAFGLAGNNEPFVIVQETIEGYGDFGMYIPLVNAGESIPHTIRIAQEADIVKKIDPKYLHSISWNDLADKPFSGGVVEIFSGSLNMADVPSDGFPIIEDTSSNTIVIGNAYIVNWNGVEYQGVCEMMDGLPGIGNVPALLGTGDNGMPFLIGRDLNGAFGAGPCWLIVPLDETQTVDITISSIDIKYLDNKYLEFMTVEPDIVIVPEDTLTLPLMSENTSEPEKYIYGTQSEELYSTFAAIEAGKNYKAVIDGEEFTLTAQDLSNLDADSGLIVNKFVALGNMSIVDPSMPVSGEPFFIMVQYAVNGENGSQYQNGICCVYGNGVTSESKSFTFSLTQLGSHVIDPVYLPSGIGSGSGSGSDSSLPEVSTSDDGKVMTVVNGEWVAQEFNVTHPTELPSVNASDNDKVLTVVNGAWTTAPVSHPTELPSVTAEDNDKVLTVVNGAWTTQTPASCLPEVTTEDAGKFLRVGVDGTWIVETIQDVSEVGL